MKFYALTLALVLGVALTGCGSKKVKYDTVKVEGDSKLKTTILWLKNKRDMIDIRAQLENTSDHPITIQSSAFRLTFEGQKGVYDSSTDPIKLEKGQVATKVIHFEFHPEVKKVGTAEFTIDPITVDMGKNKTKKESVRMKLPVEG